MFRVPLWVGCWITFALPSASLAQVDGTVSEAATSASYFGEVGGVGAFSFGYTICNNGADVIPVEAAGTDHPVLVQNLYRIDLGRFEQIGMGWCHHEFCALSQSMCGSCTPAGACNLGVGCSSPTGSAIAGAPLQKTSRSEMDASIVDFPFPGLLTPTAGTLGGRVNVALDDLSPSMFPAALYYAETQLLSSAETPFGTDSNNVSWRPIEVLGSTALQSLDTTVIGEPAIYAWQDYDPNVLIESSVVPGDGRVYVASNVLSVGTSWRYDYAVYNQTSHRSVRSLRVPLAAGASVPSTFFRDVDYHSGDPYSGVDWPGGAVGDEYIWQTDDFATDPSANALRFGTVYSFGFTCDQPPTVGSVTLELFRPGTPSAISLTARVPEVPSSLFVRGDANVDGSLDISDPVTLLSVLFVAGTPPPLCDDAADINDDGVIDISDPVFALTGLFVPGAPSPPPPSPGCGDDPTIDALECEAFALCP